jgi:hypothetical protein
MPPYAVLGVPTVIICPSAATSRTKGRGLPLRPGRRNIVKHRVQPSLTSGAADRKQEIDRLLASGRTGPTWADRR